MGLSRNKVAVSEGAAGSPPFYGERARYLKMTLCKFRKNTTRVLKKRNVVQYSRIKRFLIVSVTNAEGPPVPIPNTEVKLCSAENTCRATGRENKSMPTQHRKTVF